MASSDDGPSIESHASATWGRLREWVLLDANRLVLAGLVALGFLALSVGLQLAGWATLQNRSSLAYLYGGLLTGNLTLITVVVSINQLLLSRELKGPGEFASEMQNVVDYRQEIEAEADRLPPVEPLAFLRVLFEDTRRQAQRTGGLAVGHSDDIRNAVDDVVVDLTLHVDRIDERLHGAATPFDVLSATLGTDYAREMYNVRRLTQRHGDSLSEELRDSLDALVTHLRQINVARQYFTSVYMKNELSTLSRFLFYSGLPAEAATAAQLLNMTGTPVQPPMEFTIPVTLTLGFLPLAILFSFILRTATITQRTATITPFTGMRPSFVPFER